MKKLAKTIKNNFLKALKEIIMNDTYDDFLLSEIYNFDEERYIKADNDKLVEQKRKSFKWFVNNIIKEVDKNFDDYTIFKEIEEEVELDFDNDESIITFVDWNKMRVLAKRISEETWK